MVFSVVLIGGGVAPSSLEAYSVPSKAIAERTSMNRKEDATKSAYCSSIDVNCIAKIR